MRKLVLFFPLLALCGCSSLEKPPLPANKIIDADPWKKDLGYCYFEKPELLWRSASIVEGRAQLQGRREGQKIIVTKVFYQLVGDVQGKNNRLRLAATTWGSASSSSLQRSSEWILASGFDLPRPALQGERGVMSWSFDQPFWDGSCSWKFVF